MKIKRRKVTRTKEPSLKQMQNMAFNLRAKFNTSTSVSVEVWKYNTDKAENIYTIFMRIGIDSKSVYKNINSWKECLEEYFFLIKGTE